MNIYIIKSLIQGLLTCALQQNREDFKELIKNVQSNVQHYLFTKKKKKSTALSISNEEYYVCFSCMPGIGAFGLPSLIFDGCNDL